MSKLIAPSDLDCFATCEHGSNCPAQAQPDAPAAEHWCVPEAWQTCARCRDLIKARVVEPPSASDGE